MNDTRRLSLEREALVELTVDDLVNVAAAHALTTDCKTLLQDSYRICTVEQGCGSNTWACTGGCA